MWLMIRWLHQKPADLDLHFLQNRVKKFKNVKGTVCLVGKIMLLHFNFYIDIFGLLFCIPVNSYGHDEMVN